MPDLTPKLIYAKGLLFLLGGLLASGLLITEHPSLRVAFLLAVAIWCFARAYYFAFYVIERYVDPTYRFAGLGAFAAYLWRNVRTKSGLACFDAAPVAGAGLQKTPLPEADSAGSRSGSAESVSDRS